MAEATAPCAHCGAVLPLAQLLRIDAEGGYAYVCQECAVAAPTGKGPEKGLGSALRGLFRRRGKP
jgi:hypothetical protein